MSLAALSMLTVFVLAMLSSVLPARLGDPSWQLAMVAALVDNAVIPLVALLTLHVAGRLDQRNGFSASLRDGAARWAVLVVFGFLLLAPLQLWNGWRVQQADVQSLARQERQAELRFQRLRAAVAEAGSAAELQSRLQQLVGPGLERLDERETLPELQQQLTRVLERNQRLLSQQLQRQRQQRADARGGGGLLQAPLRGALSCLAYALAFAALARLPGQEISLLASLMFKALGPAGQAIKTEGQIGLEPEQDDVDQERLVP
ncbi:MAG: HpsJ family protein [Synechococcaceae cyanobacterium ELA182]